MDLFESPAKKIRRQLGYLLPALLLIALCALFLSGINRTSVETLKNEQVTLEQALQKGAVRVYALTGRYPQSLSQLLDDCGITYDHEKFVVEYVANSSNLLPMISVIPLSGEKGGAP
ncbi:hypothetical protein NXH76_14420 [Blautia schinkii]|nr:hypothetical protein [Blautia schinkii]